MPTGPCRARPRCDTLNLGQSEHLVCQESHPRRRGLARCGRVGRLADPGPEPPSRSWGVLTDVVCAPTRSASAAFAGPDNEVQTGVVDEQAVPYDGSSCPGATRGGEREAVGEVVCAVLRELNAWEVFARLVNNDKKATIKSIGQDQGRRGVGRCACDCPREGRL